MWKIQRQNVYEVVEQDTGRVVVDGLTEEQAKAVCEARLRKNSNAAEKTLGSKSAIATGYHACKNL